MSYNIANPVLEGLTAEQAGDGLRPPTKLPFYNSGGAAIAKGALVEVLVSTAYPGALADVGVGNNIQTASATATAAQVIGVAAQAIPVGSYGDVTMFTAGTVIHGVACDVGVANGDALVVSAATAASLDHVSAAYVAGERVLGVALIDRASGVTDMLCY